MARRKIVYHPKQDFYEILGVQASATREEIQRIYRQKAKLLHPDVNPERRDWATEQFQLLNEAYDVLSDADLRKQYDEVRWPYILPKAAPRPTPGSTWSAEDKWWEQPVKPSKQSSFDPFYAYAPPARRQAGAWLEKYGLGAARPMYAAVVDLFNSPYRFTLYLLAAMVFSVMGFILMDLSFGFTNEAATLDNQVNPAPTQVIAVSPVTNGLVPTQIPPTAPPTLSLTASLRTCAPDILITVRSLEMVGRVLQIKADYLIRNGDTISRIRNISLTQVNVLDETRVERVQGTEIVEPNIDFVLTASPTLEDETPLLDNFTDSVLASGTYWLRWTPILSSGTAYRSCDQLIEISAP